MALAIIGEYVGCSGMHHHRLDRDHGSGVLHHRDPVELAVKFGLAAAYAGETRYNDVYCFLFRTSRFAPNQVTVRRFHDTQIVLGRVLKSRLHCR